MKELTEEEAIAFAKEGRWEAMDTTARAVFQLNQRRLCMPFAVFHEAVEKTLGRPVFTHEFASERALLDELAGLIPAPTMTEILDKIPSRQQIVVLT